MYPITQLLPKLYTEVNILLNNTVLLLAFGKASCAVGSMAQRKQPLDKSLHGQTGWSSPTCTSTYPSHDYSLGWLL